MSKNFKEYLAESVREYKYTLKLAVEDVGDQTLDCLENCLSKYCIKSATAFKKTPIQESPLDFPNIRNMPVYISEIVLTYPASRDFLEHYISKTLKICEQSVVVYSENDPRQIETTLFLERSAEDFKEKYQSKLAKSTYEGEEAEFETLPEQKDSLLKELSEISKQRTYDIVENPLSHSESFDHSDVPTGYDTFNDSLPKESIGLFGRIKKVKIGG